MGVAVARGILKDYLEELVFYGGEIRSRGYIIADLQKRGALDWIIGSYMEHAQLVTEDDLAADSYERDEKD